jgi:hypothetical protein
MHFLANAIRSLSAQFLLTEIVFQIDDSLEKNLAYYEYCAYYSGLILLYMFSSNFPLLDLLLLVASSM